jgi:hypothetical protein
MDIAQLNKLAIKFEKDLTNAKEFAEHIKLRNNDILILPIPLVSDSNIQLADQVDIKDIAKHWSIHPEIGYVLHIGPALVDGTDQGGENIFQPEDVVLIKINQIGNPVFYKGTIMVLSNPGNLIGVYDWSEEEMIKQVNERLTKNIKKDESIN